MVLQFGSVIVSCRNFSYAMIIVIHFAKDSNLDAKYIK